ncbi:MAG: mechanosensitive ion channel family protein [Desulfohalobiaceae bacterium]
MSDKILWIYLLVVAVGGPMLLWLLKARITAVEERRKKRITRIKGGYDAIQTTSPHDRPGKVAKEAALEGIETRFTIIRRVVKYTLLLIWILALVFPFLNRLPATMTSIMVAAFGVIIGIASRPFIENLISGMVISFSHPVRVGDTVIVDGNYGSVEDISITHTIIKVWNWRRYIIPNSRMLSKEFVNLTISDRFQWVHVEFWVDYEADLAEVEAIAVAAATQSSHFAEYEPPTFWVMSLDKEGAHCWIAAWADSPADAWQLGHDIRTRLATELRKRKIKTHTHELHWPGCSRE